MTIETIKVMQKYIHLIYFMLVVSLIGSLTTFTTSMGILSLVINPVLAEEKQVEKSQDMKNIMLQDKRELHINNDKVNVEFAKKDKSDSDLDNNNCKSNKVLKGASNKKDLEILSECEKAVGKVKHVQEMPDGDYKFLLKLDKEYKSLLNKDNKKKTGGNLVIEIVPKDQDSKYIELPDKGDNVEVWGAWVIDKPKGWNEIHPAWKVIVT
jgi:hypothetical protein